MKARSTQSETPTCQPHLSRVARVIDLGMQPGFEWQGETIDPAYKLEITFEVRDENMKDGRPFFVSKEVKDTDSDKGSLYGIMQAAGTDCNNIEKALGAAVMMTPKIKKSGWPAVDVVAGLPIIMQDSVTALVNEAVFFSLRDEEPSLDVWDKLYDKEKEKILKALDITEYPIYAKLVERGDV